MADERMAAGAEMDAEVARRVFGHTVERVTQGDLSLLVHRHADGRGDLIPRYSTAIASAWLVVEQLREQGWLVRVQEMPEGYPYLDNDTGTPLFYSKAYVILHWAPEVRDGRLVMAISAKGLTSPEAICRAALAAAGAGQEG